jgi:UDP-GlcNAc:undecaprenyl-phosphate GlcNAc-1-phosphate transferase
MMTSILPLIAATTLGTAIATAVLSRVGSAVGLIDHPGGRKDHLHPVPLVGGAAIVLALVVGELSLSGARIPQPYFLAAAILVGISIWDDMNDLHHVPRLAAQVVAVLIMVYGAQVQLHSVGNLLGRGPIGLWVLAVPVTVFAVVGVINAVNMIDGMDGLAGSTSLVSLAFYGVAASLSGLQGMADLAWLLCGALAGFLVFNIRFPWQPRALVFLGDSGSTLLGFTLAWFAIDLTQGPNRTMPPIAALWVVLLPLADTVSLMARRVRRGCSPFHPDREHIHHFLLAHGFSVNGALALLVGISVLFGAVGLLGWRLGVPEPVLFVAFAGLFFAYHFAIGRAWRLHHARGLADADPELARET